MYALRKPKDGFKPQPLPAPHGPYDVLIRTAQGYSGKTARQIRLEQAYARIYLKKDISILAHHAETELLERIIGVGAPGLLPGGRSKTPRASGMDVRRPTAPRT